MKNQDIEKLLNMPLLYRGFMISGELKSLELFISSLENYLPHIQAQFELRARNELKKDEHINCLQLEEEESQRIVKVSEFGIPRMFNNSALLMIWACFETSAKDFADFIKKEKKVKPPLRGSGVNPIYNYYSSELGLPELVEPYIDRLREIYELRNQIIHSNGVLESMFDIRKTQTDTKLKKMKRYIKSTEGIEVYDGVIHCSAAFILKQFLLVKESLSDIEHYIAEQKNWPYLIS